MTNGIGVGFPSGCPGIGAGSGSAPIPTPCGWTRLGRAGSAYGVEGRCTTVGGGAFTPGGRSGIGPGCCWPSTAWPSSVANSPVPATQAKIHIRDDFIVPPVFARGTPPRPASRKVVRYS